MPRKTYVDNAMNRRLGRVGMPLGSCVHSPSSSSSSYGASSSGYGGSCFGSPAYTSSSSQRTYVDNATNRSLGRVGKPVGSHVVHKDGSTTVSSLGSFASGKDYASSSSQQSYVDNAMNRSLGRVGKPVGSHVVHKDGSTTVSSACGGSFQSSLSSGKMYVDNSVNRSLGRVGKPLGSHVVHRDGTTSISSVESAGGSTQQALSNREFYVDNEVNRKLGRVGKPRGSHVLHSDGTVTVASGTTSYVSSGSEAQPLRLYVDNAYNRRLGRVGKPIARHTTKQWRESKVSYQRKMEQKLLCERNLDELVQILRQLDFTDRDFPAVVNAQYELQRTKTEETWKKSGISPSTDHAKVAKIAKEIIPFSELEITKKIGEGGFGKVYAGLWKGVPIAFKKLSYQQISKRRQEQLVKEIKIFSKLSHVNIVRMFGVVIETDKIGIVMEYLPKTLYHAIFIEEVSFSSGEKKRIITEIVSALSYLHTPTETKPKISHCDIKSQNILLDARNVAKLCDFGLSAMKNSMQSSTSRSLAIPGQGTPRYSAPEVLRGEVLTMSGLMMSDIYSLSLVIYEILAEEEPYENLGILQLIENVGRGRTRPSLEETSLSGEVRRFLARGWDADPGHRPSVVRFGEDFSKIDHLVDDKQPIL